MAAIVVQFGLATMPFGMERSACGLTSATTSGTSGSMRHADELSITIAPAAATTGASSRDVSRARREEDDIEAGVVGGRGVLDDDLAILPRPALARRARRREQAQRAHRELALGQDGAHEFADQAGGADDADGHSERAVPGGGCSDDMDASPVSSRRRAPANDKGPVWSAGP